MSNPATLTNKKTNEVVKVPLLPKSLLIIEKLQEVFRNNYTNDLTYNLIKKQIAI